MKGVKVHPFRPGEFFVEPRWAADLVRDIGPVPFAVRTWLKAHSNGVGCLSSATRIARGVGLSRWTVTSALDTLEEKGLLKCEARAKTSLTLFRVIDPPCPQRGDRDGH